MGKRERREARIVKSADISELTRMVLEYASKAATVEIIDRQQRGRGLRYYPEGRNGATDFGFLPILIDGEDGAVMVRYGRPRKPIEVTKELAFIFITSLSKCAIEAISWHLNHSVDEDDPAESVIEAEIRMESLVIDLAEDDFSFTLTWDDENDEPLTLQMKPKSAHTWYLNFEDCSHLIQSLCSACKTKGWVYEKEVSDKDLEFIKLMIERE